MNTNNHEFFKKLSALTPTTTDWQGSYQDRLCQAIAQQRFPAGHSQFWMGDWRLGIAEERVAMAEERLARAEAQLAKEMDGREIQTGSTGFLVKSREFQQ